MLLSYRSLGKASDWEHGRFFMTLDEFENVTVAELRAQANNCFAQAATAGTGDRPYLYAEAQFYIAEIERRQQGKANTIGFWMELFVIVLILAEIVIALWEGKGQASLIMAQTQILQNLQGSTKSTADSLAAQLALQYEVFVNVQYNSNKALSLFNNSKNEIMFCGIKIGNLRAESNPGGPAPIAGLMMKSISLEEFYPTLFDDLPKTGSADFPITLYLKSANNQDYVAQGTFAFVRHGNGVTGSGESTLQPEKWSGVVTFSPAPSEIRKLASRPRDRN
jgi:hypothetical protein